MNFNKHSRLEGQHAFLGASKYHWINYSDEKLDDSYIRWLSIQRGTDLHAFAANAIKLKIRLPKNSKTLNMYVNDGIGYDMIPEQPLYYSENCFGTADTISFKNNFLRIHDLKTGVGPTSMHQLEIYTALFCLEYDYKPDEIRTELRIYQNDAVAIHEPAPEDISKIMNTIVRFDKRIEKIKAEG